MDGLNDAQKKEVRQLIDDKMSSMAVITLLTNVGSFIAGGIVGFITGNKYGQAKS